MHRGQLAEFAQDPFVQDVAGMQDDVCLAQVGPG